MPRIVVAINIHRPIGVVFDYITTPANWPAWHPASRAVSGSVDHSLLIGERVTEEFVAGGRQGSCVWQVTQREVCAGGGRRGRVCDTWHEANGQLGAVQIAAYVVSGIGFLGAGVIIKDGAQISGDPG